MENSNDKNALRKRAYAARSEQPHPDLASQVAIKNLETLPEFASANTVLWYVNARTELQTRDAIPRQLEAGRKVVVPYCTTDQDGSNKLGLWQLKSLDELALGKWRILEPPRNRWDEPQRRVEVGDLDLVVVPGVAFSQTGARLGNGQGYYDRLLSQVRSNCFKVGLAFECQVLPKIATELHDVRMDAIVSERRVIRLS